MNPASQLGNEKVAIVTGASTGHRRGYREPRTVSADMA